MLVSPCKNCGALLHQDSRRRWVDDDNNLICSTLALHKPMGTK